MLKVRTRLTVLGAAGPSVSFLKDIFAAHVDHRLDGDGHAVLDERPSTAAAIVGNLRVLVQLLAYTVTDKLPDNSITSLLAIGLYGIANITDAVTRYSLLDAQIEGFRRGAQQRLGRLVDLA